MEERAMETQSQPTTAHAPARSATHADLHPEEVAAIQRGKLIRIVRIAFLVLFLTVTTLAVFDINTRDSTATALLGVGLKAGWTLTIAIAIVLGGLVYSIDYFTPRKKISTLGSVFLGLVAAMLATVAIGAVIELMADLYDVTDRDLIATAKVLMGICLAYLGIATVLQTQDDFRLVIPYVEFAKQLRGTRPVLLDTSVLIDGRVVSIGRTGVLQMPLVIPRFVIDELQTLGDSHDELKRSRGRRGLDMIVQLQREPRLDVSIDETVVSGKAVDAQLVELAGTMSAMIATTDAQLARVAGIKGVDVMSINELAGALRPEVIPGESIAVTIIREGEQPGQGVGFLDDGTMVVVGGAGGSIGRRVEARVTSSLQTSAGRMIFGEIPESESAVHADPISEPGSEPLFEEPAPTEPDDAGLSALQPQEQPEPSAPSAKSIGSRDRTQARRRNPRR